MPLRGADLSSGRCQSGQPPCRLSPLWFQPQMHAPSISLTNLFSLQTHHAPLWYSPPPFLSMTIHVKTMCANQRRQAKIAAVKYGWCKTSRLNSGPSQASVTVTDAWCIRSHWKELEICFLDSFEGVGYTASASVFTNVNLALNGIPQLARSPVNTFHFNTVYHLRYRGFIAKMFF